MRFPRRNRLPRALGQGRRARDPHGRGVRSMLVPAHVPLHRTRAERFDDLVLDAVEHLETQWREALEHVDFAVEDVPGPDLAESDSDVLADGDVPLAHLARAARPPSAGRGAPQPHVHDRIVLYRRPIELRAPTPHELAHLVHDVVVAQVAHLLGRSPEEVDPGHGDFPADGP